MLNRIVTSVIVFLVTWFVVWAVAYILVATGVEPLVEFGGFLNTIDWLVGLVAGVLAFFNGESWLKRV